MKRISKARKTAFNLLSLTLEGTVFLPDQLEKAAQGKAQHQTDVDYQIPKGLKIKDEYSRAFQIARAQWKLFTDKQQRQDLDSHTLTIQFVLELLKDAFSYHETRSVEGIQFGGRDYPITLLAANVPVVVAPYQVGLDESLAEFAVEGSGSRKKSAFQLAQEFLNASEVYQWALATNGRQIRLLRDAQTLTRPSFLEIDLQDILEGQRYSEFESVWLLLHASRSPQGKDLTEKVDCVWDKWRAEGQEEGTRVREGLRIGVEQALIELGRGFLEHPDNIALRKRLHDGSLSKDAYFQQLLRMVYRLIFIFTVEERGLLHPLDATSETISARQAYAEGYAFSRLRELCLKRRVYNNFDDYWQAALIVFRGLQNGQPLLALPALGGLFASSQSPDLDQAKLENRYFLKAIRSLRWAKVGESSNVSYSPVDYRNMGAEELGSVYESLLELVPVINLAAREFGFVGVTDEGNTAGNARKLTGSYYTPDSLVQELIKSALDPVIEQRLEDNPQNPADALLSIRVVDPACGSGHFLLAAARRLAEQLAEIRSQSCEQPGVIDPKDYRQSLREVIANCIFGVDRNPMAIELVRIALWLEGFEEGRPLGFLDHHLQVGDALLGLTDLTVLKHGISKDAFKALSGDDASVCRELATRNRDELKQLAGMLEISQYDLGLEQKNILNLIQGMEVLPENSLTEINAKEEAYREFLEQSTNSPQRNAADMLIAAYLLPKKHKTFEQVPTTASLVLELVNHDENHNEEHLEIRYAAQKICKENSVFHWQLAFPQVFSRGGFDCVLANPPWERIKLQEEEFFANKSIEISLAKNKAERSQRIQWLSEGMLSRHLYPELSHNQEEDEAEIRLYREFVKTRRAAEAMSVFAHVKVNDGGRYPLTGVGDVNTYALFAETILKIHKDTGRAGFIVPTGIATDDSTKAYFGHITQNKRLVSLYDIENSASIFPIHRSFKFCLLTLGQSEQTEFVFFATEVEQLSDSRRRFTLTPEEFSLINPNTLTCPVFRSERDAELTKKIYKAAPVLIREEINENGVVIEPEKNPWGIKLRTMFHMSNDSHLFRSEPHEGYLPLYEAKLIHHFDHRWATYDPNGTTRDLSIEEKQNPELTIKPRYWVSNRDVWLKLSNLPKALLEAIEKFDSKKIQLGVIGLLFGFYLNQQRIENPSIGTYTAWQEFVAQHPCAQNIAPTSLGLAGDNPACFEPLNENYLPAEGEAKIIPYAPDARVSTAWYAVNADIEEYFLTSTDEYSFLSSPEKGLETSQDVSELAEQWLEASCSQWLTGWRDITNATNERTVIASVIPLSGVGNQLPLFFPRKQEKIGEYAVLLGNLSCLVYDFVARHKIGGTHMNYFIFKQLPILSPEQYYLCDLDFIVPRVLELTYTSHDLSAWAKELGYEGWPFGFDVQKRAVLRAELDAYYAKLYGLTRDELSYILDPEEIMGDDYPSETFRVLKNKEIKEFGEYRTQRLVLEAWDRLGF